MHEHELHQVLIENPNLIKVFEQRRKLISVDILRTVQLLGFNFEPAIGESLTQLCANAIYTQSKFAQECPISTKFSAIK